MTRFYYNVFNLYLFCKLVNFPEIFISNSPASIPPHTEKPPRSKPKLVACTSPEEGKHFILYRLTNHEEILPQRIDRFNVLDDPFRKDP
jgi:hypothetical protein